MKSIIRLVAALVLCGAPLAHAQSLDVGDWQVVQENSSAVFTFPAGTVLAPGDYVVIGRFADQAAFESFHGVTLGANVHYFTNEADNPVVPMINGAETYTILDAGGATQDGPTEGFVQALGRSHHRSDPESAAFTDFGDLPTPGTGVEAPDAVFSGLVVSEVHDATSYVYEFVELYCDTDGGGGGGGNVAPAVSSVNLSPAAPEGGQTITVTASATDSDGTVTACALVWRSGGSAWTTTAMTAAGGSSWSGSVTAVDGNALFEYYVRATDDGGAFGYAPVGAPGVLYSVWVAPAPGSARVVLFDHAHDQDAGSNGNWRVDDNHPTPVPAVPTSETSWNGQLSSWGFELFQAGHEVRSTTTLLSASVLAGVDLLVIPEPQNPFTAAEIEAVRQFVYNGGSLFFIADHNSSDRNNNGWDSPSIFGGYSQPHITTPVGSDVETFCGALFGLHVHVKDEGSNSISGTFTNVASDPSNPVIHGPYGDVTSLVWHVGNVISLWPSANPDLSAVGGLVSTAAGDVHVMAWSQYGSGKVVGWGDSSSMADGTGSESHEDNWHEASHRAAFLNATMWLLDRPTSVGGVDDDVPSPYGVGLRTWPNPFNPTVTIGYSMPAPGPVNIEIYDVAGRRVRALEAGHRDAGEHTTAWDGRDDAGRALPSGVYFATARGAGAVNAAKLVLAK